MLIARFTQGFLSVIALITWVLWVLPESITLDMIGYTRFEVLVVGTVSIGFVGVLSILTTCSHEKE